MYVPKNINYALIWAFLLVFLFACEQTEINTPAEVSEFENGILMVGEGQFNNGNASLDFWDKQEEVVQEKVFETANNRPLGDVFQSMHVQDQQAYLVLNNSGLVEIVDLENMESVRQLSGFTSPRYILPIHSAKAYVTDLYADAISVVDLNSGEIEKSISMTSWTEQMILTDNEVWVNVPWLFSDEPSRFVYAIDSATDTVIDSVEVGIDPVAMVKTGDDAIWVVCKGNPSTNEKGGVYRVNTNQRMASLEIPFEDFDLNFAPRIVYDAPNDYLYFTKKEVFRYDLNTGELTEFVKAEGRDFYALGVDPNNGHVFLSDAIDFQQRSTIFEYDQLGTELRSFKGGIGTNGFIFN